METHILKLKLGFVDFRVRTVTGDHREEPVQYNVSSKGTELLLASFSMSRSVQQVSVWVETRNSLGSVKSSVVNYTVSDIGKLGING